MENTSAEFWRIQLIHLLANPWKEPMAGRTYALSIKQPWAALLVHGKKTIEVRRWPTARRGRILIHAARIADERPEAWNQVPPELRDTAKLIGGILGAAELIGCVKYPTREAFILDQPRHLNDPAWHDGSILYGFQFAQALVLPFRRYSGWMRFFPVEEGKGKWSRT